MIPNDHFLPRLFVAICWTLGWALALTPSFGFERSLLIGLLLGILAFAILSLIAQSDELPEDVAYALGQLISWVGIGTFILMICVISFAFVLDNLP